MRGRDQTALSQSSKVPAVTLGFWIIKIAATTLGETGGDTVSMTMNLGYLTGTAIFLAALAVLVVCQIMASRFHPVLYWATIVASTTAGTTMADFADRSLGIGYAGGSSIPPRRGAGHARPVVLVGAVGVGRDGQPAARRALLLGNDHAVADARHGARGLDRRQCRSRLHRGIARLRRRAGRVAAAYYWTSISRVVLFWAAFILTRPLGATVGDLLDKPLDHGGLALSRPIASAVIASLMIFCIMLLPHMGTAKREPV